MPSSALVRIACAVRLVSRQHTCRLLTKPTIKNRTITTVPSGVKLPRLSRLGRSVRNRPVLSGLVWVVSDACFLVALAYMKGNEMSIQTKLPMEVMLIPRRKWLTAFLALPKACCFFVRLTFLRKR